MISSPPYPCENNGLGDSEGASLSATGLSSASPIEPVPVSPLRASIPSAQDIEDHLLRDPEDADYVVQMPQRTRIEPEEIWIEGLGAWLRTDGSYASFDLARGGVRYDAEDREILQRIVAYWKTSFHAQAIEARRAETHSCSVHESAVGETDAPKKGQHCD